MYIVYDPRKDCLVGLSVKMLEEARERARACKKEGRLVIIKKIQ